MFFAPPNFKTVEQQARSGLPERAEVRRGHPLYLAQEFARAFRSPRTCRLEGQEWTPLGDEVVAEARRIADAWQVRLEGGIGGASLGLAIEIFDEAIARVFGPRLDRALARGFIAGRT